MKLLVTSGPTRESLDGVRYITNGSTGRTGAFLSEFLCGKGFEVTTFCGKGSAMPKEGRVLEFDNFSSLDSSLIEMLGREEFDAIIHLAAVSDFSVGSVLQNGKLLENKLQKIESDEGDIEIKLKRNFKIVDRLKSYSRDRSRDLFLVAFKLTNTSDVGLQMIAAKKLLSRSGVDLVVHNDLSEIDHEKGIHRFRLIDHSGEMASCDSVANLAERLEIVLKERK